MYDDEEDEEDEICVNDEMMQTVSRSLQHPLSSSLSLSSRPPNNNIISIENKVSSHNFTSCLATLIIPLPPPTQV